jgi:uncharacterized protein (TIGR00288 family)
MDGQSNIAMFIDCDNISSKYTQDIFDDLSQYGDINIRKAYGNWKDPKLKGWEDILQDFNIQPIQQFAYTQNKNASDIAIVIDIMDALYTRNVDAIALLTSDSDFTPIVTRVLAEGKSVYGYGESKTPKALVNACSRFIFIEKFKVINSEVVDDVKNSYQGDDYDVRKDKKLKRFLIQAVEQTSEEDDWADLKKVGLYISRNSSFSPINYGFKKLGALIKYINIFEIQYTNNNLTMLVRVK